MFPDKLSVTVVGSFTGPDGRVPQGYVYYTPSVPQVTAGNPGAMVRAEGRMEVGETGAVRGIWLNPHGEGVSPAGWNYRVVEAFHGVATNRYTVSIPSDAVPDVPLDLMKLPRVIEPA